MSGKVHPNPLSSHWGRRPRPNSGRALASAHQGKPQSGVSLGRGKPWRQQGRCRTRRCDVAALMPVTSKHEPGSLQGQGDGGTLATCPDKTLAPRAVCILFSIESSRSGCYSHPETVTGQQAELKVEEKHEKFVA